MDNGAMNGHRQEEVLADQNRSRVRRGERAMSLIIPVSCRGDPILRWTIGQEEWARWQGVYLLHLLHRRLKNTYEMPLYYYDHKAMTSDPKPSYTIVKKEIFTTAAIYFHLFYMLEHMGKHNVLTVACACFYLAGKYVDSPKIATVKQVAAAAVGILPTYPQLKLSTDLPMTTPKSGASVFEAESILKEENAVLIRLMMKLQTPLPYENINECLALMTVQDPGAQLLINLLRTAFCVVEQSVFQSNFLRCSPLQLAMGSINIAARIHWAIIVVAEDLGVVKEEGESPTEWSEVMEPNRSGPPMEAVEAWLYSAIFAAPTRLLDREKVEADCKELRRMGIEDIEKSKIILFKR